MDEIKTCQRCNVLISNLNSNTGNYYRHISVKYCDECRVIVNREKGAERVRRYKERQKKLKPLIREMKDNYITIDGIRVPTRCTKSISDDKIGYYVYWFSHPDERWVYVGKSCGNLNNRILSHKRHWEGDNIDDKYRKLIDESDVYFTELTNPVEADFVESILINQHKPIANIAKKYEISSVNIELNLNWKKYNLNKSSISKE